MGYYTPPSRDTLYIFYSDKSHYGGLDVCGHSNTEEIVRGGESRRVEKSREESRRVEGESR